MQTSPNYVLNRTVGDMLRSNQTISALGRLARRWAAMLAFVALLSACHSQNEVGGMNEDSFVSASLSFNATAKALELKVRSKSPVAIMEIQGDRKLLDAFGATMPPGFSALRFGEGVEVPEEMKADIDFMNKAQFRWGTEIKVSKEGEVTISMPASGGPGTDTGVLTLAYSYPKLFGLLKGKSAIYVHLSN